jgi:hypothetical protein
MQGMPLMSRKPTDADVTKLHDEINQYSNQRLTIVTTAVTIFFVANGWIVSSLLSVNNSKQIILQPITFVLSVGLLIILYVLFLFTQFILGHIYVLASYLRKTDTSQWEKDYEKFLEKNPTHYLNRVITIIFFLLGFFSCAAPLMLPLLYSIQEAYSSESCVLTCVGVIYLILVGLNFCSCNKEKQPDVPENNILQESCLGVRATVDSLLPCVSTMYQTLYPEVSNLRKKLDEDWDNIVSPPESE